VHEFGVDPKYLTIDELKTKPAPPESMVEFFNGVIRILVDPVCLPLVRRPVSYHALRRPDAKFDDVYELRGTADCQEIEDFLALSVSPTQRMNAELLTQSLVDLSPYLAVIIGRTHVVGSHA
jgi:hypothetical protein